MSASKALEWLSGKNGGTVGTRIEKAQTELAVSGPARSVGDYWTTARLLSDVRELQEAMDLLRNETPSWRINRAIERLQEVLRDLRTE